MKPTCSRPDCGKPSHNGFLCRDDRALLTRRLAEIPALYDDLRITLARQGRTTEPTAGGSTTRTLVIDIDSANLAADLNRVLTRAVRHLQNLGEKTPCQRCRHAEVQHHPKVPWVWVRCRWRNCSCGAYVASQTFSIRGMAQWLERRTAVIALDPQAGNLLDALSDVSARIWAKIDGPRDLRVIPIAPCPEIGTDGRRCEGEIRAHIPRPGEGTAVMSCTACAALWMPWQWTRVSMLLTKRLRPAARRVPAVEVDPALIDHRGSTADGVAVIGRTVADHQRKLDEGLIS